MKGKWKKHLTILFTAGMVISFNPVNSDATDLKSVSALQADKKYFQVTQNTPIYSGDQNSFKIIGELKAGTPFERVHGAAGAYISIMVNGNRAFLKKEATTWITTYQPANKAPADVKQAGNLVMLKDATVYDRSGSTPKAFAMIKNGQTYPYLGAENDYYKIEINGLIGYIHTDEAQVQFPSTPTYFKTIKQNIPIYNSLNLDKKIIGYVKQGHVYPRAGAADSSFHKISYGKGTGYVSIQHTIPAGGEGLTNIVPNSPAPLGEFETLTDATVYQNSNGSIALFTLPKGVSYAYQAVMSNGYYEVHISGLKGFIKPTDVERVAPADSPYYKALSDLDVYYSKEGVLEQVAVLKQGDIIRTLGTYGANWYKIQFGNQIAYISSSGVKRTFGDTLKNVTTNTLSTAGYFQTTKNNVPVYDNTSGTNVPFLYLSTNKIFSYVQDFGANWYKVQFGQRVGYIYKGDTNEVEPKTVNSETLAIYADKNSALDYTQQKNKVGTISYGEEIALIETAGYVSRVMTKTGITGWVYNAYLQEDLNATDWIVRETRNLRSGPEATSSNIGSVSANAKVKVLAYTVGNDPNYKHWYKIRLANGTTGWIWGAKNSNSTGLIIHPYDFAIKMLNPANQLGVHTPLQSKSDYTAEEINQFLDYKVRLGGSTENNMMLGMGATFVEASRQTGISIMYLVSHASLETAWGRSQIARDKFNYFGIAAYDRDPYGNAYNFNSKENGILEGARWINNNYVTKGQDTVHSMRNNNNSHQYATDEAWHHKIANIAKDLMNFVTNLRKS